MAWQPLAVASSRLTSASGFWESSTFSGEEVRGPPQSCTRECSTMASGRACVSEESIESPGDVVIFAVVGPFDVGFQSLELCPLDATMKPVALRDLVDQLMFSAIARLKVVDQLIDAPSQIPGHFPPARSAPASDAQIATRSCKTATCPPPSPAPESEPRWSC